MALLAAVFIPFAPDQGQQVYVASGPQATARRAPEQNKGFHRMRQFAAEFPEQLVQPGLFLLKNNSGYILDQPVPPVQVE